MVAEFFERKSALDTLTDRNNVMRGICLRFERGPLFGRRVQPRVYEVFCLV